MKNLNVLLGVVFGLIVGAGAVYVGMGTPTEKNADETASFTTQSVRGGTDTTSLPKTTTPGTEANGDDTILAVKVTYYGANPNECTVHFDDKDFDTGITKMLNGRVCCEITHKTGETVCYRGDEMGVKSIDFRQTDENHQKGSLFTTQSVKGTNKTFGVENSQIQDQGEIQAMKVKFERSGHCLVYFDGADPKDPKVGITKNGADGQCCEVFIKGTGYLCFTKSDLRVTDVYFDNGLEGGDHVQAPADLSE